MVASVPSRAASLWIWQVLVGPTSDDDACADLDVLSPMELARSGELAPQRARAYLTGRCALRAILGEVTHSNPATLAFERRCATCGGASHGRPMLAPSTGVEFSVAYSDRLVLVAVSFAGPVGVDVEPVTTEPAVHRWTYAPSERALLVRLPPVERAIEATRAWVRKEAVAKACGRGLSLPLADVELTGPRPSWRLPHAGWSVDDLLLDAQPAGVPVVGAVARERGGATHHLARWAATPAL